MLLQNVTQYETTKTKTLNCNQNDILENIIFQLCDYTLSVFKNLVCNVYMKFFTANALNPFLVIT